MGIAGYALAAGEPAIAGAVTLGPVSRSLRAVTSRPDSARARNLNVEDYLPRPF